MNKVKEELPAGIRGWSWGAFFLTWIWGLFNSTYRALWCLVPIVNIFMWIALGFKGREWAWRHGHWDSVDHFNRVQRKWSIAGIIYFVVGMIFVLIFHHHISFSPRLLPHHGSLASFNSQEDRFMTVCKPYMQEISRISNEASAIQSNHSNPMDTLEKSIEINYEYKQKIVAVYGAWQKICFAHAPKKNHIPSCQQLYQLPTVKSSACEKETKRLFQKHN